jgi:hypothetical protein
MSTLTKTIYQSIRKENKDPIQVVYKIYNHCSPDSLKINSINQFQGILGVWLGFKRVRILNGCLMILKYFDKEFA